MINSEISGIKKFTFVQKDSGYRNEQEMLDSNVRLLSNGLTLADLEIEERSEDEIRGTFKGTDKNLRILRVTNLANLISLIECNY